MPAKTPRRASAKDVARLAGVSTATVSRVLNSPERVEANTQRLVSDAVSKLRYVPHGAARALRSRRSRMVGAVVPSFDYALYARTTSAMQTVLDAHGYATVLAEHHYDLATEVRVTEQLSERWYFEGFTDAVQSTRVHLDWYVGRWQGLAERAQALTTTGHDRFARLESLLVTSRLSTACGLPERAGTDPELLLAEVMPHEAPELLAQAATEAGQRRLGRGDPLGAAEVTDDPTAEVLASRSWLSAMEIVPGRIEALVAAGRRGEAAALLDDFEGLVAGRDHERPAAALALCRGLILEQGDPEGAAAELGAAADALTRLPRPYDAALVRIRRAECLLRAGCREQAVSDLRTSRGALADLQAWPHVARVEARLGSLGVRGSGGTSGRRAYGDELSPRERDVVRLVAEGRTNRQIAQDLVLSSKTVANHVATARRKLRAPSRTALAVVAIAAGVIEHPTEQLRG